MAQGVVVPPAPLRTRHRGGAVIVALAIVATVGLALLKPWVAAPASAQPTTATPTDGAAAVAAAVSPHLVAPTPSPRPWPALPTQGPASLDALTIQDASALLALRAGTWGVGAGGSGPRLTRDEVWADWVAVTPHPLSTGADGPPAAGACDGLQTLDDRPAILAVTAPAALTAASPAVIAWWSSGGESTALGRSVLEVRPASRGGVTILQRLDQAVWPPGRYDFEVRAGGLSAALAVCLGGAT